jgi:hypothetical protein
MGKRRSIVERVIPLPRPRLLTSALLIGTAVGLLLGVGATLLVSAKIRPDVAIALVVGVPGVIGMVMILLSRRRWLTAVGAFVIAIAPGWFGALVAIQTVNGA